MSEKSLPKNEKEDKENISKNEREYSGDAQVEKKPEKDLVKNPQENLKEPKRKRGRTPFHNSYSCGFKLSNFATNNIGIEKTENIKTK